MSGERVFGSYRRSDHQGDNTTGPKPSHMLKALIATITMTKMTACVAIFARLDLIDSSLPLPATENPRTLAN
jgi:hypothetical protein